MIWQLLSEVGGEVAALTIVGGFTFWLSRHGDELGRPPFRRRPTT